MNLTQKETGLLTDLKTQEQLCVQKYATYSADACDAELKQLFADIQAVEQQHVDSVSQIMNGSVPSMSGGHKPPDRVKQSCGCGSDVNCRDSFLCRDALATEKHVSSVYDTCIFEFSDTQVRNALNHIQKEEQEHGEQIHSYMSRHGM